MIIQIVLVVAILGLVVLLGQSTRNARHMAFRRIFLLAFAVASVLAIAFPEGLSRIAQLLGVGRGADLLLYTLVVAFIGSLAMQSRRAGELSRMITLTTRRLAILEAEAAERAEGCDPKQPPAGPAEPTSPGSREGNDRG